MPVAAGLTGPGGHYVPFSNNALAGDLLFIMPGQVELRAGPLPTTMGLRCDELLSYIRN